MKCKWRSCRVAIDTVGIIPTPPHHWKCKWKSSSLAWSARKIMKVQVQRSMKCKWRSWKCKWTSSSVAWSASEDHESASENQVAQHEVQVKIMKVQVKIKLRSMKCKWRSCSVAIDTVGIVPTPLHPTSPHPTPTPPHPTPTSWNEQGYTYGFWPGGLNILTCTAHIFTASLAHRPPGAGPKLPDGLSRHVADSR